MSVKTYPFTDASDHYDKRHDGGASPLPDFNKSPLVITKKMISKANQKRGKSKNSSELSSSSGISRSDQMIFINRNNSKPRNLKLSSSLGSLMAADMPLSPSPVCSSPTESETIFSSPSSNLPCDCSRASGDCHTPTHQSSSMSFRKQEQSPKCMSISTIYESAIDHNHRGRAFDSHGYALGTTYTYSPKSLASSLPPHHHEYESSTATTTTTNSGHAPALLSVIQDTAGRRRRRRQSGRAGQFTRAIPVRTDQEVEDEEEHPSPANRPKPYHEFLDEVQSHRRNAELSARTKAVSTRLFDQMRRKETAIDDWEAKQRNKQEFQLDKLETKLDKKRAKAVQKMHQRVAEINVEAERKKAKERRSFLKKMDRLSGQTQENKARVKMLFHPWSCCCNPVSVENPDSNQVAIF